MCERRHRVTIASRASRERRDPTVRRPLIELADHRWGFDALGRSTVRQYQARTPIAASLDTRQETRSTGRQGDREIRGRGLASFPTWTLVASSETLSAFRPKILSLQFDLEGCSAQALASLPAASSDGARAMTPRSDGRGRGLRLAADTRQGHRRACGWICTSAGKSLSPVGLGWSPKRRAGSSIRWSPEARFPIPNET